MRTSEMTRILKRVSLFTGFAILAISIYFSYDGFDQSVSGANDGYTTLATVIGLTLAVVVTVMQFIFGTAYRDLNWTLRFAGVAAYAYSIYTNYLGIKHVLGADEFMAWASALFMDIYPEPAIAWALGEALSGDLVGNLGKIFFGDKNASSHEVQKSVYKPQPKPAYRHQAQSTVLSKPNKPSGKLVSPLFNDRYTNRFKPEQKQHKQGEFIPFRYDE